MRYTSFTLIFFCALLVFWAGAQDKAKMPPQPAPKVYTFTIDSITYSKIDSILVAAVRNLGYVMTAPEADRLRGDISDVVRFFRAQKEAKDTVSAKNKK
jgi:hypothetical protein